MAEGSSKAAQEAQAGRMKAYYEGEFRPSSASLDPAHRIANALEYIAAQMGQINRKLDKIIEGQQNPADRF